MPVSHIIRSGATKLTNQQIADFMLQSEREYRDAMRRCDYKAALEAEIERDRLASAMY